MRIIRYLSPAELALIIYLLITGTIILFNYSALPQAMVLISIRIAAMLFTFALVKLQQREKAADMFIYIRFFFPLVILSYLYSETDSLNNLLFNEDLDPFFSQLEGSLFGFQPALDFAQRFPSNAIAELMYFGYFSYYLMLAFVPLYILLYGKKEVADRAMFIIIHSFFLYYLFFILFPVAGPQFYFTDWPPLPGGYFFGETMRFIQQWGEAPTAAFPSSHVSISIMLVLISARDANRLVKLLIPLTFLLILSTVYIRAHYVIDVLAAILLTPFVYRFSGFVYNRIPDDN